VANRELTVSASAQWRRGENERENTWHRRNEEIFIMSRKRKPGMALRRNNGENGGIGKINQRKISSMNMA
jgi:hypothetical protein